jgi:predicted nucleotidyltransferase
MEDALAAYFARRGDVRLALLFGSQARGDARPGSDVDVAVQFEPSAHRSGLSHPRFEVAADLERLCRRAVDVVDLAAAPPVLSFAIAGEGRLLFEKSEGLGVEFRAAAYDRYFDTAPLRRVREQYLLEDILGR